MACEQHHEKACPACHSLPESLFASARIASQYLFKTRGRVSSHSSVSWLPGPAAAAPFQAAPAAALVAGNLFRSHRGGRATWLERVEINIMPQS